MKVTKALVKRFEEEQKKNDTETAIFNILWLSAVEMLNDIGVKQIKTSTKERR
jgi:hypothetical protein